MKKQLLPVKARFRTLIAMLLAMAVSLPASAASAGLEVQQKAATLILQAPTQVDLGDRIEIHLIVEHARNLAGYETQLLFDTSAAHFSGFHQRDSDLKKFGNDVILLEEGELPDGVTFGLASCPYKSCVELNGKRQPHGANGQVRLGSVLIGTDQEGILELRFEHLKFVDSTGKVIPVKIPQSRIFVQVGSDSKVGLAAPGSTWAWPATQATTERTTQPTTEDFDITRDGSVKYADATEVALEWILSREQGQPCGPDIDLSRDVNSDGCIDVSDIQFILANTAGNNPATRPKKNSTGPNAGPATSSTTETSPVIFQAGSTFTVNSTSDASDANIGDGICATGAGVCSLRAAINEANNHNGPDTILFNIPGGGVQTIQLNSRLPSLWDNSGGTTIDGYSQPGAQPNTDGLVSNALIMIQLRGNGPGAFDAMQVTASGNIIRGLAIFNVRRSIWIYGSAAQNNLIAGNFLGTNAAGTFGLTVHTLNANGIEIANGASNNQVGGTSLAQRNVISGNARHGIDLNSEGTDNNAIYNNLIGLNPAGNQRLMNLRHGIDINAGPSYNIIGGTEAGQRNILSGNGEDQTGTFTAGVEISHDTLTTFNSLIGNCIGTNPSCMGGPSWASNRHYGVRLEDGVNNNIIANNVIGNNLQGGIRITGSGTNRNQIHDNRIGISLDNTAIGNSTFGIQIARSSKFNTVGPNNIIAHNGSYGVQLLDSGTDNHTITQDSIYNNSLLGIDLGTITGVTPNDGGDSDTGTNEELNWPDLDSATLTQVTGTACSEAAVSKPCIIEVFIAEILASDSGGGTYGQGKIFVGSGTTNNNGSFAVAISGVTEGQYLTATATDAAGNTSEFAQNIQVSGSGGGITYAEDQFSRTIIDGWGDADVGGSYTLTGNAANYDVDGSAGTMTVPAANSTLIARLPGVAALDLELVFRVKTDQLAVGSNQSAFFSARNVSSNTEYRGQIRISTSNLVYIRATKVVSGTQTMLGTEVQVPGFTYVANSYIWMRGQVIGTNPTTIQLKAWADGQPEPAAWQYVITDSEPSLQAAGSLGLRAFLAPGVTNAPVVFTFDDLLVISP